MVKNEEKILTPERRRNNLGRKEKKKNKDNPNFPFAVVDQDLLPQKENLQQKEGGPQNSGQERGRRGRVSRECKGAKEQEGEANYRYDEDRGF